MTSQNPKKFVHNLKKVLPFAIPAVVLYNVSSESPPETEFMHGKAMCRGDAARSGFIFAARGADTGGERADSEIRRYR